MVRGSVRMTACALAAALTFSGMGIQVKAADASSVLPSGGVDITEAVIDLVK